MEMKVNRWTTSTGIITGKGSASIISHVEGCLVPRTASASRYDQYRIYPVGSGFTRGTALENSATGDDGLLKMVTQARA